MEIYQGTNRAHTHRYFKYDKLGIWLTHSTSDYCPIEDARLILRT